MKTCLKCKVEKTVTDFFRDKSKKDGFCSWCKTCSQNGSRLWRIGNSDRFKQNQKVWRKKNRVKINRAVCKRKRADPSFGLAARLRSRISKVLCRRQKVGSAVKDLGCSSWVLKEYIESLWQSGMSWSNWGVHGWHIDHIVPLSSFDLTDIDQFRKACHYTNLQPLWAKDNLKKHNKVVK